jgi:hypothetical protein
MEGSAVEREGRFERNILLQIADGQFYLNEEGDRSEISYHAFAWRTFGTLKNIRIHFSA